MNHIIPFNLFTYVLEGSKFNLFIALSLDVNIEALANVCRELTSVYQIIYTTYMKKFNKEKQPNSLRSFFIDSVANSIFHKTYTL
jgi:hypothetical protein